MSRTECLTPSDNITVLVWYFSWRVMHHNQSINRIRIFNADGIAGVI